MLSPSRSLLHLGQPVNLSAPLNSGLVSWWMALPQGPYFGGARFLDLCGKNHGTLNGAGWGGALGRTGGVGRVTFDGDDYVSVPGASGNALGFGGSSSEFTISLWTFYNNSADRADVFGYKNTGGGLDFGIICNRSASDNYGVYLGGDVQQAARPLGWSHVLVTRLAGSFSTYVNGKLGAGPTAESSSLTDASAVLEFGRNPSGVLYLTGAMDSIRIYPSRGFTATDAAALYADECCGCPSTLNYYRRAYIFDVGGGGGGSFKAAWARGSNVILGMGGAV